ncbi:MAG: metallophosphoesterase family protein [Rhodothermales bacterium]
MNPQPPDSVQAQSLIFADLHLGRDPAGDPARLADLLDCVSAHASHAVLETVIFLGDTFDAFIDAPGRVPPAFPAWADVTHRIREMGAAVRFFSGNHDRWHLSAAAGGTIASLIGSVPHRGPHLSTLHGFRCFMSHGDEYDALSPAAHLMKKMSDTRLAYAAYRTALPFGGAQWLAQSVSSRLASFDPQARTVGALRATAERILARDDADIVVFGHAHHSECTRMGDGWYVNTGDWHHGRSYVVITPEGPELRQFRRTADIE